MSRREVSWCGSMVWEGCFGWEGKLNNVRSGRDVICSLPLALYRSVNWGVERERKWKIPNTHLQIPGFPQRCPSIKYLPWAGVVLTDKLPLSLLPSVPSSLFCQAPSVLTLFSFESLPYSGKLQWSLVPKVTSCVQLYVNHLSSLCLAGVIHSFNKYLLRLYFVPGTVPSGKERKKKPLLK